MKEPGPAGHDEVGQRVRHLEWQARTSGATVYTGDVPIPDALVAQVLRSPHAHARIRALDVSAAERAPGVAAVITAADFGDARYIHHGGPLSDRRPLARDVVRFVGEEVAAVAAETLEQAEAAVRLIKVRYGLLPEALTVADALRPGAPRLHERPLGPNIAARIQRTYGTPPPKAPPHVSARGRYRFGRQAHVCMEPSITIARWDADRGVVELWTSTQAPYFIRKEVAHVLGLDLTQVITHEVGVGGGFGARSKISDHEALAAALSRKANRAVKLALSRDEEFATTKSRHEFEVELETVADRDGRLLRRDATVRVNNGAYNHSGPSVMGYGCLVLASAYRVPGVTIDAALIDTNTHPGGQFRGYGGPQATFALESQMDELAEWLRIDPIDLRIRNANHAGDVTLAGWRIQSAKLVECLEAVREASDWDRKRARGDDGRGIGVAAALHVTGARVYEGAERSSAGVDVGMDGLIRVRFGGADAGTWQKTILGQIAAAELGVSIDRVEVLTMETEHTPTDMGAWSSRGTYMSGHAVRAAAQAAAARLRDLAASKLGGDAADVRLQDGDAITDGRRVPIGDLVALAPDQVDGELRFEEDFLALDAEPYDPQTGYSNLSPTYSFAAQAVEVQVDRATGKVEILDVVAAHDSGIAINPTAVESQIIGGVVMGLGAALGEELRYESGRMVNPAYLHYPLPRAADVPRIRPILIQHADPSGPYGAKGVGEISLVPTAAAVANAVAHAVGVRIRDLPITPDKVLSGLRAREGRPPRPIRLWRRPDRWWIEAVRRAYPRGLHHVLHRYGTRLSRPAPPSRPVTAVDPAASAADAVRVLRDAMSARPVAGGTDLLPARQQGLAPGDQLVDLLAAPELASVEDAADGALRIGATVRLADLAQLRRLPGDRALAETIDQIASAQIREMATVGGNLCQQKRCWFYRNEFNCYKRGGATCPCYAVLGDHRFHHAAMGAHRCQAVTPSDLATTLLALDASVVIAGPERTRSVPIEQFYSGPGETILRRDEIVREVVVPGAARARVTRFEKVGLWEGDFAVVSACASLARDAHGIVRDCRIVLGAVAPTPVRAARSERLLVGHELDERRVRAAAEAAVRDGHPLPGNAWKLDAAEGLVRRCLEFCAET